MTILLFILILIVLTLQVIFVLNTLYITKKDIYKYICKKGIKYIYNFINMLNRINTINTIRPKKPDRTEQEKACI